jgi:hypothetical protein
MQAPKALFVGGSLDLSGFGLLYIISDGIVG